MTLWILDTDHISLWQRQHTPLLTKLDRIGVENIAITVITVEEQFRGRLDMVRRANSEVSRISAYGWVRETTLFLGQFSQVLAWGSEAERIYGELKQSRSRWITLPSHPPIDLVRIKSCIHTHDRDSLNDRLCN